MRLYVTGGTGLVGSNVIKVAQEQYNAEVVASLYGDPPTNKVEYHLDPLDIRNHDAVEASIRKFKPAAVIHSAALLDPKVMYTQRKSSWEFMVEGTRAFARACREIGARLVFVSSDWVFDGYEPLVDEDTPPHPVNFYGIMKVAAERELSVMDGLNYGVGRLAAVYGFNYANPARTRMMQGVGFGDFVNYVAGRATKGERAEIWTTEPINNVANPTLATDGADLLLRLAHYTGNGIFHCFGSESISRMDLAKRTAEAFGCDPALVTAVPTDPKAVAALGGFRVPIGGPASSAKTTKALGRAGYNVTEGLQAFKREWDAVFQS